MDSTVEMTFWIYEDAEAFEVDWEKFRIELVPLDREGVSTLLWDSTGPNDPPAANAFTRGNFQQTPGSTPAETWTEIKLGGLGIQQGKTVQVRFIYDSYITPLQPAYSGIFIDDVSVNVVCDD